MNAWIHAVDMRERCEDIEWIRVYRTQCCRFVVFQNTEIYEDIKRTMHRNNG